jgi:large subunit ribosomal protein L23
MELNIHEVIKNPVISDKAYRLYKDFKKVVFNIHISANKAIVAHAVKALFEVEVESVRILRRKGKRKVSKKRSVSFDAEQKRAIVTLKKGYVINVFGDIGAQEQIA